MEINVKVLEYDYPHKVEYYHSFNKTESEYVEEWLSNLYLQEGYSDAKEVVEALNSGTNYVTPPLIMVSMYPEDDETDEVIFCIYPQSHLLHIGCSGGLSEHNTLFQKNVVDNLYDYIKNWYNSGSRKWIDPAGGVHRMDEEDPAKMYE